MVLPSKPSRRIPRTLKRGMLILFPLIAADYLQYIDPHSSSSTATPALLTRWGYKGHNNNVGNGHAMHQDRIIMLWQGDQRNIMALFDLFDGHGSLGHNVAHVAALDMLQRLLRMWQTFESTSSSTFLKVSKALPKETAHHSDCTAIVLIHEGSQVLVATNAGDSRALVDKYNVQTKEMTILYQTCPHKPHLSIERNRTQATGGHGMLPKRLEGSSSHVLIPMRRLRLLVLTSHLLKLVILSLVCLFCRCPWSNHLSFSLGLFCAFLVF